MSAIRQLIKGVACGGLILGLSGCATAEAPQAPVVQAKKDPASEKDGIYRQVTKHELRIGTQLIEYEAIAGETILRDLQGEPRASIFSFSYIRTDKPDPARPVLFIFNGGPGSASLWIHMGAIGPRRVVLDKEVNPSSTPPYGLEDNPNSVLDVADLVFIDPVGTGFSKAVDGVDPKEFWGVDEDAESVAQFIELWLNEHGRWNSPKYVLGESYGTMRAAVLPRALMGSPIYNGVMRGITLNGIILLGTTLDAHEGDAEKSVLAVAGEQARDLPGLAATAAFHGLGAQTGQDAADVFAEARTFADGPYTQALAALAQGTLEASERQSVLDQLQAYTGLTAEEIGDDLYVPPREFAKVLLKGKGLEAGMYDSRYTLPLEHSGNDPVADDPAMGRYVPGFIAVFNEMLRDDLDVHMDRAYIAIHWRDLLSSWNWTRRGVAPGQSFATDIAWSMRRTPALRLFVASGYYDLVTMPTDAYAALEAAGVPADRVRYENYESGHMLYLGKTSGEFASDLREFLTAK